MRVFAGIAWHAAALYFVVASCAALAAEPTQAVPLRRAHAHNDYAHARPLADALDHGFTSVEADIFLRPEGLLVGHAANELTPERTLQKLYLDPLRARARANGGRVYPSGPPFYLLIDVKSEAEETYAALDKVLAGYADILSVTKVGKFHEGPVTIVLSGNRAKETVAGQKVRYVGIDGRPEDLKTDSPAHLVPWISANWTLVFTWRGEGPIPDAEKVKLADFVAQAHGQGRQARLWATPESQAVWRELLAAGVDRINTDKLAELQAFLSQRIEVGEPMTDQPLAHLDDWEESLAARYPAAASGKPKKAFRDYRAEARSSVKEFYRLNHRHQTLEFVLAKKREYLPLTRRQMGIWEAMEFLNTLVDDSDPDTDLSQIEHLMQTAEAIRRDGHPRWFILTGLIHDLGKILCLFGEPQWAVVGDTFPVGCRFSGRIVFSEFFADNPDASNPKFQSECGIYEPGCSLDKVHLSWGHDEYLYHVTKDYLPEPAQYMIRYHSFYPAHSEGAYGHLMNDRDRGMFRWVRAFNPYDLYSKDAARPDVRSLRPYYEELIAEFFPAKLAW